MLMEKRCEAVANTDQENLAKSTQSIQLLLQDLQELMGSKNVFLADIALELLKEAGQIEWRLKRIMSLTVTQNQAA